MEVVRFVANTVALTIALMAIKAARQPHIPGVTAVGTWRRALQITGEAHVATVGVVALVACCSCSQMASCLLVVSWEYGGR